MNKLILPGKIIFATGMIGLGIICFLSKDFIVGRPSPWPASWNVNPTLAYISGAALILASLAIILNIRAKTATLLISILILVLSVIRSLPNFAFDYNWLNGYKCLALFGGALIITSIYFTKNLREDKLKKAFIITGSFAIAIFFIEGGYSHFKFDDFVKSFIPSYIPFHAFWTYFCGICLIAGGIGLVIPQTRRLAALLSAIMVGGWFILLHIPRFLSNTKDASDRLGLCESFAFTGFLLVLTGLLSTRSKSTVD